MAIDWLVTFRSKTDKGVELANTICVHDNGGSGGVDPASASELLDEVDSWLTTLYRNFLASSITLDELHAFRIPETYGDDSEVAGKLKGLAGTRVGLDGKIPIEQTLVMALRSSSTSRRHQGRLLLPSSLHGADMGGDGRWGTSSGYWTGAVAFGDALLAGHDFDTDNHLSTRIYSRQTHRENSGDKTKDVATYVLRREPHWLRRRATAP